MDFLELVNRRLDFVKEYRSERHYQETWYAARRWVKRWGKLSCSEVTRDMVEQFLLSRKNSVSAHTANKELRQLRALFNLGIRREWIEKDPTKGLDFFPVEKRLKWIPSQEEIDRVIAIAAPDVQDYLWAIRETMARVGEINRLEWKDVDFEARTVALYTRKKRGGHLTPRRIPMTQKLYEILSRRHAERDNSKRWVFWHGWNDRATGAKERGPYKHRKRLMRSLCAKAKVPHFGFHALRHAGASLMEQHGVPIGSIQRILGHENRTTTEIYLHTLGAGERQAIEVYEEARRKVGEKSLTPTLTPKKMGQTTDRLTH